MAIPMMLEPRNLQGLYEKFGAETPSALLKWFPDRPAVEVGNKVQYDIVKYGSDVAQVNIYGGAPNAVKPPIRGTVMAAGLTMSEEIIVPATVIKGLRDAGSTTIGPASAWVARAMKQLRIRVNKRKALLAAQALGIASGSLSFTLPGAASATTVSLGYSSTPNNHATIGSAWQTASTGVLAEIIAAKLKIAQDSGKQPTDMVMNSVTGAYLSGNDEIIDLLSDNARDQVRENGVIPRIAGLDVTYVDETYVNDLTGTATGIIPDDFVAILAGDSTDRAMIECAPASLHASDSSRGMFFWVVEGPNINDPIKVQCEITFLPYLPNPDEVVYDTDVT